MATKTGSGAGRPRRPFSLRQGDRDYSGTDVQGQSLADEDCSRSFFNGTDLTDCLFSNVSFANCEFAEARLVSCRFENCDFTGADLVSAQIVDTVFDTCNFATGEWREANFERASFAKCSFEHTTVALCIFVGSVFDRSTVKSMQHRAVALNVFTLCTFEERFDDAVLVARNFGTPIAGKVTGLITDSGVVTLDDLCTLNNCGQYRAAHVAKATEAVCAKIADGSTRRTSSLLFLSKIIRVLAQERRLSATTLLYLEAVITATAAKVSEQELFVMAMHAAVEIRTALFAIASEVSDNEDGSTVERVTLYFSRTYARRRAEVLADLLARSAGVPHDAMRIEKFETGSTLIEIVTTAAVTTSAVLVSLNFALRQAKITLERMDEIKKAFNKLKGKAVKSRSREVAVKQTRGKGITQRRAASVIGNPEVAEQLTPVRQAVSRSGRTLIELDEPVTVRILAKQSN